MMATDTMVEEHVVRDTETQRRAAIRSDQELLAAVASRDKAAFQALFERHADRVFRFAMSIVRNAHLAEEVMQETMIAVWRSARRFEGRSKASTWILGIARNLAHNLLRKEKRGNRMPEIKTTAPDPADGAEREVRVQRAMEALTDAQREVLHLVYYEELGVREAAAVLGIPEGTVKSRMFHARKTLAKELT
ncbi:MAG: sigma-70 family RNA polymerase sigma factor [Candidatus Bipolaricaulia bacterium]